MTREDINDIINAICPNDEDYEKPCISPKYLREELEQLALDQRQWNEDPTTKNDLGVDCISRQDVLSEIIRFSTEEGASVECQQLYCDVNNMPPVTPQEPSRDMEEIKEVINCDADAETKCKMISNILTAKLHYFKEPFINKPCVSEKVCEHDKQMILDKIRAEIKALSPEPTAYDVVDGNPVKDAIWEILIEVDKIIDKYKAESEER